MEKRLTVELHHFVRRQTFPGWEIRPRRISDHELVYVVQGQGDITIEGRHIRLEAGDLVCFRPGAEHNLSADREPCMLFYGVHFGLEGEMDELPLLDVAKMPSRKMDPLFRSLEEAVRQKGELWKWRQDLIVSQIICEAMLALREESEPIDTVRIRRVLEYIHEDPCRPLPLEALLQRAGVRKTAFLQSFRRVTGTTPLQYIQNLRLEYACDLLIETDLPVAQAAERCGFSDPFYFSRCFRKRYGVGPRQWRSGRKF